MSNLKDQIKDLVTFAKDTTKAAVKGGRVRASPEDAAKRYQLCLACPYFVSPKCTLCGCTMGRKVQWETAKCADKERPKW